jgi:hypothetical protein
LTTVIRNPEEVMADINAALTASKEAVEQLIVSAERCGPAWAAPRAPGLAGDADGVSTALSAMVLSMRSPEGPA